MLLLLNGLVEMGVEFVRELFVPPDLLTKFVKLSLKPRNFNVVPLSARAKACTNVLVTFVFNTLPLASRGTTGKSTSGVNDV